MTKKIGLIGAGYICEYHAKAIQARSDLELEGVVDIDTNKAEALASQFNCKAYSSLEDIVNNGVKYVHILTPPSTHIEIATAAIKLGCDVFVEKPLAEGVEECKELKKLAKELGRIVCVNHSLLYDPQIIKAKEAIHSGKLGKVISIDILRSSVYPTYPGGEMPPHYRDGGYPFRDLGVHCLYLLEHFLGEIENVDASWKSIGGDKNLAFDEWSSTVSCKNGIGRFQLSWNIKPLQNLIIIQGTKGVLRVDSFLMFNSIRGSLPAPKVVERIVNNYTDSLRPIFEMPINIVKFAAGKIVPYQGLTNLIYEFYNSIEDLNKKTPVTIDEAIPTVKWVEHIARKADKEALEIKALSENLPNADVLVTGGTGGLGSNIVKHLLQNNYKVRVFSRSLPTSPIPKVQYITGSLGNAEIVNKAVKDTRYVIHAGAAMQGDENEHLCGTLTGTENIISAVKQFKINKLIHISSLSVVDWASNDNRIVDESADYEPNPTLRGYYTQYKLKAEQLVLDACKSNEINAVIFRPGQIFGEKLPLMTGAVARTAGKRKIIFGDGEINLPLIYIDDVSDAVVSSINIDIENGTIFQLTDEKSYTQNHLLQIMCPNHKVIRIPRNFMFIMGGFSEYVFKLLKRQSPFSRYRLKSAMPRITFKSEKAKTSLGWSPKIGVDKGIQIEKDV